MQQLDFNGLVCPMPLIRLKKALAQFPQETVFELNLTDRGSLKDIPAFCAYAGLMCETLSEQPIHMRIRRV